MQHPGDGFEGRYFQGLYIYCCTGWDLGQYQPWQEAWRSAGAAWHSEHSHQFLSSQYHTFYTLHYLDITSSPHHDASTPHSRPLRQSI